jgi:hypothetical protein
MLVALQVVIVVAFVPLKETVLEPCDDPKFEPKMVTAIPNGPDVGFKLVIWGPLTRKFTPLLAIPPTVTTTLPVVAPAGTSATTLVALQLAMVAVMPLKVTALDPCDAPKFEPETVTAVPADPDVGFRLLILGVGALKITPFAPELVDGLPSGVDVLTLNCALPEALLATLTLIVNVGIALVRPGTEVELMHVIIWLDSLQVQLPDVTEAKETKLSPPGRVTVTVMV